jgi:MYXO-CTERM domain-containing protein
MKRFAVVTALAALSCGAAFALTPTDAQACGGTFCDSGAPMPVDQSGENILFVIEQDYIEAHIQIQYTGDPEKFGWVIPLQSEPDPGSIVPGSELLFRNVLAGTVPAYGFTTQRDECSLPQGDANDGFSTGAAGGTGGGDDGAGDSAGDPGVQVLSMQQVGSFEVSVIQGTDASAIVQWLDDNGYQQDPESEPIIEEYIAEGHVFAAVKLTDGAGLGEIHPIAFRFRSSEPCVPLRLTRIAAVEDMEIRTFFLGDARTVPRNYRHVVVNDLKLDWPNFAGNYKEAITLAVDAESADGRAFVTEYAGPSDVVNQGGIFSPSWNADAFRTIAVVDVVDEIMAQGLWGCNFDPNTFEDVCGFQHPLLGGLVDTYLPVPDGVDPLEFYNCVSCFEGQLDPAAWDGAAFADAMQARIIDPGARALALLTSNPYLTRMYTTISPGEMTEDPMFWQNPALPAVDNTNASATQRVLCNGDAIWSLPNGRDVYLPAGATWPDFDAIDGGLDDEPERMPMTERISEIPENGAEMELVNNTEVIDAKLAAYNAQMGWNGTPPAEGEGPDASSSGCGCTVDKRGAGALWMLVVGVGLGVTRRRRRR